MADSGYVEFSVTSTSNNVKLEGRINWAKVAGGVTFKAWLAHSYSRANNQSKWVGNNIGKMRLLVDGSDDNTGYVNAAGARGTGLGASGSGWRINDDFGHAETPTITRAEKSSPYALTLESYGNGTATDTDSVTIQFDLPLFVNVGGSIKKVAKVYTNVGGAIKECTLFTNVGGVIKTIK